MNNIAIIFDMDGVLLDSMCIVFQTLNQMLEPYGKTIEPEDYSKYSGTNAQGLTDLLKKEFDIDFEVDYVRTESTRLQLELLRKEGKATPGVIDFIKELKENNISFGIGTSSPKERAYETLKAIGISKYFDVIVHGDMIEHHKPHPETFTRVADQLGMEYSNCIVFEDSESGIEAAHRGGMKAVGVRTKSHPDADLGNADYIIDSFENISLETIKKI